MNTLNLRARVAPATPSSHSLRLLHIRFYSTQHVLTLLLCLGLCIPTKVYADILFTDDFQQTNSDTPSTHWYTSERDASDIAIYRDRLRLRDYQSDSKTFAQTSIDALSKNHFTQLSLSFDWQVLSSTESSDYLHVGFGNKDLSDYQTLFSVGLGEAGTFSTQIDLIHPVFHHLSFWLDVNSQTEGIYLDNIILRGDATSVQKQPSISVSEAHSLSLLCLGLFALWGTRRANNNKPTA